MSIPFCSGCGNRLPQFPPVVCEICGAEHWLNAKPCASGLVVYRDRLLMVQRAHDPWREFWDVPGGFCGGDEHPIVTAEREVLEETGLVVAIRGLLGMWMDEYGSVADKAPARTTLNIYYHAVPIGEPDLRPDPTEVLQACWFEPHDLPADLAFPRHIVPVLAAWRKAFLGRDLTSALLDWPHPADATRSR